MLTHDGLYDVVSAKEVPFGGHRSRDYTIRYIRFPIMCFIGTDTNVKHVQ